MQCVKLRGRKSLPRHVYPVVHDYVIWGLIKFVAGSLPCSERFFVQVLRFSLLLKNQQFQISIWSGTHEHWFPSSSSFLDFAPLLALVRDSPNSLSSPYLFTDRASLHEFIYFFSRSDGANWSKPYSDPAKQYGKTTVQKIIRWRYLVVHNWRQ